MNFHITVKGIVIGCSNVGEYDKRMVLMTVEKGKITVFARGVRRPGNSHMAACQPFTFGNFILHEGRDAYNLVDTDIENYFMDMRADLSLISYGLYFCELIDYFVKENQTDIGMLKLLYRSLQVLCTNIVDIRLVRCIFELKILMLNGEGYNSYECQCGKREGFIGISHKAFSVVCPDCANLYSDVVKMSPIALYTINYIFSSSIEKLYSFDIEKKPLEELIHFNKQYMSRFVDRKLKSLDTIKNLC